MTFRRRNPEFESLESRSMLTVELAPLSAVDIHAGKDQFIPLQATESGGLPVSFSATAAPPGVTATVVSGGRSWRINVSGVDSTNTPFTGTLELRLFEDSAPLATSRIIALTQTGFYNNIIFHRIIQNFMTQGGDPTGTGSGGSPLPDYADEYRRTETFTSRGLLALANSGDDTNDSQFFIVDVDLALSQLPQHLNFNHTILGVLTSGHATLAKMIGTPVDGDDRPLSNVTITSAEIFTDTRNGVLRVSTPVGFSGPVQINVTATNGLGGAGNSDFETITVNASADTVNDRPFLMPVNNVTTIKGVPASFSVQALDIDGDTLSFIATDGDNPSLAVQNASVSGTVTQGNATTPAVANITITPTAGFSGVIRVMVGVRQASASNTLGNYDTQVFTVTVRNGTPNAAAQTLSTALNTTRAVTLTGDDGDPNDAQTLTYEIVGNPQHGTISNFNPATGALDYVPTNGYRGFDSFTFRVRDSGGTANGGVDASAPQTITLIVGSPWQNALDRFDVTGTGGVTNNDAFALIADIRANGSRAVPLPPVGGITTFYDVTGNDVISNEDAFALIAELRNRAGGGAGEGESTTSAATHDAALNEVAENDSWWEDFRRSRKRA